MNVIDWFERWFPDTTPTRTKALKVPKNGRSEHVEQREFVSWFRRTYPETLIIAIPNGGARHPVVAAKLKLEGVVTGVPDLYVPEWGLWIEMKAIGGRESNEQLAVMHYLAKQCGHICVTAWGCEHAKSLVTSLRA